MTTTANSNTTALRWAARTSGTLLCILVGVPSCSGHPPNFVLTDSPFALLGLLAVHAGYIVGWKAERTAVVMIGGGFLEFYLVNAVSTADYALPPALCVFLIPGILYLMVVLRTRPHRPA
jgi:hypothetical protein